MRTGNYKYHWADGVVVADDPEKLTHAVSEDKYRLSKQLAPYFEKSTKELIIYSPYFVPGKSGLAFFKALRDRGVEFHLFLGIRPV